MKQLKFSCNYLFFRYFNDTRAPFITLPEDKFFVNHFTTILMWKNYRRLVVLITIVNNYREYFYFPSRESHKFVPKRERLIHADTRRQWTFAIQATTVTLRLWDHFYGAFNSLFHWPMICYDLDIKIHETNE